MSRSGILTERFDEALGYAVAAHDSQRRKGTDVPYAAHLLGVAALVLEAGGTEDEAIAGLLHDIVEDQGGASRLAEVRERFGDYIAEVVLECSAEDKTDDPGWRVRKKRYLAAIETCSTSALLVSLADKVHNARSIVTDVRLHDPATWERFNADDPKDQSILWYYRSLYAAYADRDDAPSRLLNELESSVNEMARLIGPPPCPTCQSTDVVELIWGLPGYDTVKDLAGRPVQFRGCALPADPADYRCLTCDAEWIDPQYDR